MGADEETVRVALKRAVNSGMILGWRLVINPSLLGRRLAGMQLDVEFEPDQKGKTISLIKLVDGVILILDFHGRGIRVVIYYENDKTLARKIELIRSLAGYRKEIPYWETKLPKCTMKLKEIDWKILELVRKEPRRDVLEISSLVETSTRTITRRLKLMNESKVAYLIPIRNVRKSEGLLCSFLIFCEDDRKNLIQELLVSRNLSVDFGYTSATNLFLLTLVVDNLVEAEELLDWIRKLDGVRNVKMELLKDFIFVDEWLDETIDSFLMNPISGARASS